MQHQLKPGALLDDQGVLKEAGYATRLVKTYDRSAIRGGALRIKEWDYYCIVGGDIVLALTIADNSYMSLDSVSLLNLQTGFQHTWSGMGVMTLGKRGFPATSVKGDVGVETPGYALRFENDGARRVLTARVDKFHQGKPLTARVILTDEPEDSMVIATPFPGKKTAFYYNQKINCMKAEGDVTFDGQVYPFHKEEATAVLDWGRGVWTYSNTWYWGSASGYAGGVPFGFNLGYGFGDTSAATENMLFCNGKAHKLTDVDFGIPKTADGKDDFLKPWHVKDTEGRLDLIFTPILDRASRTSVVLIESDQHQVFGRFDGKAVLDDGTVLEISRLTGFAEKVKNRW
ncbi:MAG: DUF2804 domain-containing protein [bacterium]|nr:DUF2804 domain-containing protein [bacterium]